MYPDRPLDKRAYSKINFLISQSKHILCGYSKVQHTKHTLKQMDRKKITILSWIFFCLSGSVFISSTFFWHVGESENFEVPSYTCTILEQNLDTMQPDIQGRSYKCLSEESMLQGYITFFHTQLSTIFILLINVINVKMPNKYILEFKSRKNMYFSPF